MSIIVWLIVGLIAGWLAGMVMGGRGFGVLGNIVVGIVGAMIGGFLASTFLGLDVTGFNLPSILVAFLGAVVFLLILRAIPGNQPFER
ncbi:MAG: GlsB/YeaQ/YmgE family stress response membrane protein [Chloroflexota bacterium]